jgi:hypothetical protein
MFTKKVFLLVFVLSLSAMHVNAATLVDGYIVLAGKDTMRCKIEIPRMTYKTFELFSAVSVQDNTGKTVTYKARDRQLNGFGFVYDNVNYEYHLWKDNNEDVFAVKTITGKRVNLLYYYTYERMGGGSMPVKNDVYILQDSDKNSISISGGLLSGFKKKIKRFFEGKSNIVALVDTNIFMISDLPKFVTKVNALK